MKLNYLISDGRLILSPTRPDVAFSLPALMLGDDLPIEVRLYYRGFGGAISPVSLTGKSVSLAIGPVKALPAAGFWTLTTAEGDTCAGIPVDATASDVAAALLPIIGDAEVSGGSGEFIITYPDAGQIDSPSVSFSGDGGDASLQVIFEGDETTPMQIGVSLFVTPASIGSAQWTTGSTTVSNSASNVAGKLWRITFDANLSQTGFFRVTVDGSQTALLPLTCSTYDLQSALISIGKSATVISDGNGFLLDFVSTVSAVSISGSYSIDPFLAGSLCLDSDALRGLMRFRYYLPSEIVLTVEESGVDTYSASYPCVIASPVSSGCGSLVVS